MNLYGHWSWAQILRLLFIVFCGFVVGWLTQLGLDALL